MTTGPTVDGVLVQWGERLFYPASRIVKPDATPRLNATKRPSAAAIRQRIAATVARRAPQVMVKVTGGGRGMGAIAAHFRYCWRRPKTEPLAQIWIGADRQMFVTGLWALSHEAGHAALARLVLPPLIEGFPRRASEAARRELNRSLLAARIETPSLPATAQATRGLARQR